MLPKRAGCGYGRQKSEGRTMSQHYDTLETRTTEEREQALMRALPQQIAHAKGNAPFFATWLKDVDPASVTSRAALAKLPVLRKSMLGEVQK
jgi:phenylacetate-CoA ligase